MQTRLLFPLVLTLSACSAEQPTGECGVSFCIPADAKIISRVTPVDDFNHYKIKWRDSNFSIYEGNHPRPRLQQRGEKLKLDIDPEADLRIHERRGSILVRLDRAWPSYLDVSGFCGTRQRCAVADFAAELTLR